MGPKVVKVKPRKNPDLSKKDSKSDLDYIPEKHSERSS